MENFDRIQKYLLNELSSNERHLFEEEVQANEELAMELELQRFELETIDQIEEDSLREKATQLKEQIAKEDEAVVRPINKKNNRRLFFLAVAASITLIAGYFVFGINDLSSSDILAKGYDDARLDFGNSSIKSGTSSKQVFQSKYVKILKDRDIANMGEAITYFSNFSSGEDKDNEQARLNLGHAYLLANQFNDAISTFTKVETSAITTSAQIEEATFFKAMALLGNKQKSEALSILKKLEKEGRSFDVLAKNSLGLIE
jgi:hypothetical protein